MACRTRALSDALAAVLLPAHRHPEESQATTPGGLVVPCSTGRRTSNAIRQGDERGRDPSLAGPFAQPGGPRRRRAARMGPAQASQCQAATVWVSSG